MGNYRPISLLPLPGKIQEKIVHKRILAFLDTENFLSPDQGGFRKGCSTTATIADLTDDIFTNVNRGRTTLAAFIDLKKAFDTVNFDILLCKLNEAGIRGSVFQWCRSYLLSRSQSVIANGVTSPSLPLKCGVPQGSVLGPLFFIIYINDLQHALNNGNVKLYADDTVLYQSGNNADEAGRCLQANLNLFSYWCTVNKLTINTTKSKLMVFGSRSKVKKEKNVKIYLNGDPLQKVPTFKYLGMTLDSTLNYKHHISSVLKTVLHKLFLLSKLRVYLTNDVALRI